ncbi:MAG: hypothetical protein HZA67_12000 [Rhodospirillales bacterium]|nr:hypothetical protein [Rhodospirillales bacterium]
MSDDPLLVLLKETHDAALSAQRAAMPLAELPRVIVNFSDRLIALETQVAASSASDFTAAMLEANKLMAVVETTTNQMGVSVRAAAWATLTGFLIFGFAGLAAGWLLFRAPNPLTLEACTQAGGQVREAGGKASCGFWILKNGESK